MSHPKVPENLQNKLDSEEHVRWVERQSRPSLIEISFYMYLALIVFFLAFTATNVDIFNSIAVGLMVVSLPVFMQYRALQFRRMTVFALTNKRAIRFIDKTPCRMGYIFLDDQTEVSLGIFNSIEFSKPGWGISNRLNFRYAIVGPRGIALMYPEVFPGNGPLSRVTFSGIKNAATLLPVVRSAITAA